MKRRTFIDEKWKIYSDTVIRIMKEKKEGWWRFVA